MKVFAQSTPVPLSLIAPICTEIEKKGWKVSQVLQVGYGQSSPIASADGKAQAFPVYSILSYTECKNGTDPKSVEFPEIKI